MTNAETSLNTTTLAESTFTPEQAQVLAMTLRQMVRNSEIKFLDGASYNKLNALLAGEAGTETLVQEIVAARKVQIEKGYDPQNDDCWHDGELAVAAGAYALAGASENERSRALGRVIWPACWEDGTYTPRLYRDNLIRSGALLLAELERLERLRAKMQFWWVDEPTEIYFAHSEDSLIQYLKMLGAYSEKTVLQQVKGSNSISWGGVQVTLEDLALDFLAGRALDVVAQQIVSGYGA